MFSSLFRSAQPAPASVTTATAAATGSAASTTSKSTSTGSPTPTATNTNTSRSSSSSARPSVSSPGLPSNTSASSVSSPRAHAFPGVIHHAHPHFQSHPQSHIQSHPQSHHPHPGPGPGPGQGPTPRPSTTTTNTSTTTTSTSSPPPPPPVMLPSSQRQIEEARNAVVASIGNMLDRELSGRAAQLHANNAAIERQERDVGRAIDGLRKENDKLARLATEHTRKVKEIGNVQNWAEMLEREFLIIEETLRVVRDGDSEDDDGETGSEWSGSECPEGCECGRDGRKKNGRGGEYDGDGDVVMGEGEMNGKKPILNGNGKGVHKVEEPEMVPLPESPPPEMAYGGV
ncbi:hypothetical protein QBC47DRAFT_23850 [Echria macrotheca]|uniref:Biogenesis of lysosome-related organelles complex 1 subunit 1 n=1 Tax=Echria macrotheca TaxID=438768 RepID=A0AAJ0BSI1_9PEZI|nr:hypothetical protein QBC47DRAFT_23850 [Echria macrotheca]